MALARDIGKSILAQAPNIAPGASTMALRKALDVAIDGVARIPGAKLTAANALQKSGSAELAIDAVIKQHVAMAGAQGFVTNLGGLATLAVSIPANVSGVTVVQCRMVAAIAHLRGYDVEDPRVRSAIMMCLLGESNVKDAISKQDLPSSALAVATAPVHDPALDNAISERVLAHVMSQVGGKRMGLLASKRIPGVGGGVGAATDGWSTWSTGSYAKAQFINRRR